MFKISFKTDNAAFDDGEHRAESARILREIADKMERLQYDGGLVYDVNGNSVGEWKLTGHK